MKDMKFNVQTPVFVGENCLKKNALQLKPFGKKAYVITSDFGACRHYSLEDMEEVLTSLGIEYKVNKGAAENPPVEVCAEMTEEVRAYAPDFLVAVGGGSSLDTAKAVDILLSHPGENPYEVFYNKNDAPHTTIYSEGRLPLIACPTTAGTGSEVTGYACLTRADTDTKLAVYQNVFCSLAFLDPRYIREAPKALLHTGVMDALCHSVESYVNVRSNVMNRAMGEVGMKMFATFKDNMLNDALTDEDYGNMLIASYFDGMSFYQSGTCLPHGMSYPLSHHKGVLHGLACAVFEGEYLKAFKNQTIVEPIVKLCGFETLDEFCDYMQKIVAADVHMECTREEVKKWAYDFAQIKNRLERHPEPITAEEIEKIHFAALKNYIV
ncbi:MAG: iron-containing alcohol dehydrogenase [Clostridium sp.]|nr:iron-containing alcohol dehydrogenase [Clostridium sp.]